MANLAPEGTIIIISMATVTVHVVSEGAKKLAIHSKEQTC